MIQQKIRLQTGKASEVVIDNQTFKNAYKNYHCIQHKKMQQYILTNERSDCERAKRVGSYQQTNFQ